MFGVTDTNGIDPAPAGPTPPADPAAAEAASASAPAAVQASAAPAAVLAALPTATLLADADADAGADLRDRAAAAAHAGAAALRRTGSWFDEQWEALTDTPAKRRRAEWFLVLFVTLVAALPRFWNLGQPMMLVFDETFYVKDSWSLVHLGYEAKWPEGVNDQWAAGNPDTYLTDAAYVVHPPLGKLLIGLGMLIVGADNAVGWRITVAVLGTLAVPLLWFIAKRLFRSAPLATLAAGLLAVDGHAIVLSRITILDGILMVFLLLGFLFVLLDRDDQRAKLAARIAAWRGVQDPPLAGAPTPTRPSLTIAAPDHRAPGPDWGPALWSRPWLAAAAVAFACASAVKWSGLYFLAAFCVYSLVIDLLERRRQGVTFWVSGAILKQGPVSFLLTIPIALAVYLATWIPWFSTSGGFYRNWAEGAGNAWTGALAWVPLPVQSLWHYQSEAYRFHMTLQAEHPYQAAPYSWPFLLRPTAFSYTYAAAGDGSGCEAAQCVTAITSISNPLIWWLGTAAIILLLVLQVLRPSWQSGLILVAYGAGYLPWLAVFDRQAVFQFYAIVMLPFMILAIVAVVQQLIGTRDDPRPTRTGSLIGLLSGIGLIVLVSCLFLPVWLGIRIPGWYWALTHWLPGWK